MRAWVKKTANEMKFVDEEDYSIDKLSIAQVVYDGEWKTRHAGISVLLQTFNLKTEIPVKFGLRELRLSDPQIFDVPMMYITGHENFNLNKAEIARLRQYLLNGGFLFAEACCGRKGFDLSFRKHIKQILPEYSLKVIPQDNAIFQMPNKIQYANVTPALAAQIKTSTTKPILLGIEIDGQYAVVYSPFGMAGGWEMSQSPYAHGYDTVSSLRLGQDILMYTITH